MPHVALSARLGGKRLVTSTQATLLVLLMLFSNVSTQAAITFYNFQAPTGKISGTNCHMGGYVASPYSNLTSVTVTIGGEQITPSSFIPGIYGGYTYNITFASTHFANGTNLTIKVTATNALGETNSITASSPPTVYNVATIYGRNEWEIPSTASSAGTAPAKNNLLYMKHDVSRTVTFKGWAAQDILADIVPCTAFYVNTHGNYIPTILFISDLDEITGSEESIYPADVGSQRSVAYNQGLPPVNIAFIDACWTGKDNAFADAFLYPFTDYQATDQAEIGWAIETAVGKTNVDSTAFWNALASGLTAKQARDKTVFVYLGKALAPGETQILNCYGDFNATLQGAYTGTEMGMNQTRNWWYSH